MNICKPVRGLVAWPSPQENSGAGRWLYCWRWAASQLQDTAALGAAVLTGLRLNPALTSSSDKELGNMALNNGGRRRHGAGTERNSTP